MAYDLVAVDNVTISINSNDSVCITIVGKSHVCTVQLQSWSQCLRVRGSAGTVDVVAAGDAFMTKTGTKLTEGGRRCKA